MCHEAPQTNGPYPEDAVHKDLEPDSAVPACRRRRPIAIWLVAGILLLTSSFVVVSRISQLAEAYSFAGSVHIAPSYYVARAKDLVLVATGLIAGVGLLLSRRFGWWAALCHCYWRIASTSILPMAGVLTILSESPEIPWSAAEPVFWQAGVAAILFLLILLYLNKKNVVAWFDATPHRGIATNVSLLVVFVILGMFLDMLSCPVQGPIIDP